MVPTAGQVSVVWTTVGSVISCQIPIFLQTGCHSDANCPMERPICGAGASDSSGSSLEGSGSDDGDIEGSGDESHRCGCSSDSDCFELEATLPDNLTAICEDNVCVEGCRCHVFTILTAGIEFDRTHIPNQKQSEKSNWLYENYKIYDDFCKQEDMREILTFATPDICRADTACLGWNEQYLDTSVNMCVPF